MQAGPGIHPQYPGVKRRQLEEDGTIIIRPATSFSHITNDPIIKKHLSMLGEAVDQVGGPQVRNTATIGGNICNGATSADSASTMCALNATVVVKRAGGSTGSAGYRILYRSRTYGQEAE